MVLASAHLRSCGVFSFTDLAQPSFSEPLYVPDIHSCRKRHRILSIELSSPIFPELNRYSPSMIQQNGCDFAVVSTSTEPISFKHDASLIYRKGKHFAAANAPLVKSRRKFFANKSPFCSHLIARNTVGRKSNAYPLQFFVLPRYLIL